MRGTGWKRAGLSPKHWSWGLNHASPPRAWALGPGTADAPPGGRARVSRGLSGEWSRRVRSVERRETAAPGARPGHSLCAPCGPGAGSLPTWRGEEPELGGGDCGQRLGAQGQTRLAAAAPWQAADHTQPRRVVLQLGSLWRRTRKSQSPEQVSGAPRTRARVPGHLQAARRAREWSLPRSAGCHLCL